MSIKDRHVTFITYTMTKIFDKIHVLILSVQRQSRKTATVESASAAIFLRNTKHAKAQKNDKRKCRCSNSMHHVYMDLFMHNVTQR